MSEFGLIEHIARLFADVDHRGWEAIGDDCTLLPIGGDEALVVTTDMLVEDVHFVREATSAEELGRKALAVNLSDVAAMGLPAVATLLSVALPANAGEEWAREFIKGYHTLSKEQGVALVGGDTTASKDKIVINVVAVGRGPLSNVKRRSAAKAGDAIYVGGQLGASALGLKDILAGEYDTPNAVRHRQPVAQSQEGVWLGGRAEVHAMMDLSDGLASDLCHILHTSHCAAEIFIENIPAVEGDVESAVCGGEDYKLLFTVDADSTECFESDFEAQFGFRPYRIGQIVESAKCEIIWMEQGRRVNPQWHGFTHF
ncbi:MAG: thiamine-phosphate kinase [Alistipes sp.]|nr:thiamine-phosphate kinase [Alistipes sp.]MBR2629111.1 thiamine-phosphate kinase [Alistipes sp.]